MKLVRAKITEEVNSRLVNAGVDPLKSRLPQTAFQKQRTLLQQMQELKAKVNIMKYIYVSRYLVKIKVTV